ncbi:hypothetical protein N7532_009334 [Penicillium argentinense]|uniref:Cell surface protein n=1 Tax=Penicillium argentinense TaxID=1131581 RepID=A0A9W9EZ87_9EURO|nr:uncharacterized protein N7532_009334 [Penicillium argentinense]KAJ5090650.1 hypothetical protein N7532_009334 [Penicillium argentinense]
MSGLINKVKDAVHHHGDNSSHTGNTTTHDSSRSSNYGPHDSNTANAADPRVDSDRSTYNTAGSTYPTTSATGTTGSTYDRTSTSTNHGPHDSNIANKADPRFDSDRDNRASHTTGHGAPIGTTNTGHHGSVASHQPSTATTGTGTTAGTGYGTTDATNTTATGPASSTAGPHKSNIANEADPRVDSDMSKAKNDHVGGEFSGENRFDKDVHKGSIMGGNQIAGLYGSKAPTTTKNFDQSQHETLGAGAGSSYNTGTRKSTSGPHKSDMANKLDPRVDSDLDGSKTVGSNAAQPHTQTQRF